MPVKPSTYRQGNLSRVLDVRHDSGASKALPVWCSGAEGEPAGAGKARGRGSGAGPCQGLPCELVRRAGAAGRTGGILLLLSCSLTHLDTQSHDNRVRIQPFKTRHPVGVKGREPKPKSKDAIAAK